MLRHQLNANHPFRAPLQREIKVKLFSSTFETSDDRRERCQFNQTFGLNPTKKNFPALNHFTLLLSTQVISKFLTNQRAENEHSISLCIKYLLQDRLQQSMTLTNFSITMPHGNEALWLDVVRHVTSFSQSVVSSSFRHKIYYKRPWSSGYGRQLMFERQWVRIPAS